MSMKESRKSPSPATVAMDSVGESTAEPKIKTPWLRNLLSKVPGPLIGLIVIVIALSFLSPYFLTSRNLLNIVSQVSAIGIMSVGALLIIIVAGIDLSVGSVLALSAMTMAYLFSTSGLPFGLAMVIGLATGVLCGFVNGILVTYGRLQPFIATLATMSAAAGLAVFITGGNTVTGFPDWFLGLTRESVLGIPVQGLLLVAVFLIAAFWLNFRPSGRALYAIGGNNEVARLSGIPIRRTKIVVYSIAGFLAAVGGLVVTSRLDSAQPMAGTNDLLNVIAVVVIGGASLSGGTGSVLGTFIGLLIIGVLNNGMSLLGVSPNLQPVVLGLVIVAAVMTDRKTSKAQS